MPPKYLKLEYSGIGNICYGHQNSLLDNGNFGPVNKPYWEMKEGRVPFRYPDLMKALKRESVPSRRRHIPTRHKIRIFGSSGGAVQEKVAS